MNVDMEKRGMFMGTDLSKHILKKVELRNGQQLVLRKPIIEDAESIIEYLNLVGGESDNLLFGKDEFHFTMNLCGKPIPLGVGWIV